MTRTPVQSQAQRRSGAKAPSGPAAYAKPQHHVLLLRPAVASRLAGAGLDGWSGQQQAVAKRIIQDAKAALASRPESVTDKPKPLTGDAHDYTSLSIYYNPNPDTPDGLPYVQIDGVVNPEIEDYDAPRLIRLSNALYALSTGYLITNDEVFAQKAMQLLGHWFLEPSTRMNPHMEFAQYIPGDSGVRGPATYPPRQVVGSNGRKLWVSYGGLIEGVLLPGILGSIDRLRHSVNFTASDDAGLRAWFESFLQWMLGSPLGEDERLARNNHGTWYCVQKVAYALAVGRHDLARGVLERDVPERLSMQLEIDGSQPEELVRTNPLGYACFTLAAFCDLAIYGERLGVDLWRLSTQDERSLSAGLNWLQRYLSDNPKAITYPGNPQPLPVAWSLLSAAQANLGVSVCPELDTFLSADHPYRLLHPISFA